MRAALLLVMVLAACGPKNKNQCPGTTAGTCLTEEICSFDKERGCNVCQCRPLDQGNDDLKPETSPDDQTAPPIPVH